VLGRIDGCTAEDALEGFTRQMKKLPGDAPRQTLNWETPEEAMAMGLAATGLAKRCT
jgi:IS30 family transposase